MTHGVLADRPGAVVPDGGAVAAHYGDPLLYAPDGEGWWDVPVPQVSTLDSTQAARQNYLAQQATQKPLLG